MENRYSSLSKLNQLLAASFEAERIYYNASEDVQEVELKRFLSHQSVNRNRFSHGISEFLVQSGIEPGTKWAEKGNLTRDWMAEKKVLEKKRPLAYLRSCKIRDEKNLKLYAEVLEDKSLDPELARMLRRQSISIKRSLMEADKFNTGEVPMEPVREPKVRKLRAI